MVRYCAPSPLLRILVLNIAMKSGARKVEEAAKLFGGWADGWITVVGQEVFKRCIFLLVLTDGANISVFICFS